MNNNTKIKNVFLGPKAENSDIWEKYLKLIFTDYIYWRRNYFPNDKIVIDQHSKNDNIDWVENLDYELNNTLNQLKAHFPFYSPRYMAHMLSEQTLPAVLGYFAGMLYNPNNVTDEAAPVTVDMELEFGNKICQMLGYKSHKNKPTGWAHICSGGTIANIEALWIARETQFIPLILKEYFTKNKEVTFSIKLPSHSSNDDKINIVDVSDRDLLHLKTNEKIYMFSKAVQEIINLKRSRNPNTKETASTILSKLNEFTKTSAYSIRYNGFINVISKLKLKPVIFVPESAHYSWEKAASILGYGANSIRKIPITNKFRINIDKLKEMISNISETEYIAAVITVAGTTEEGAVDPIHDVKFLRDELEQHNISFWLHIDAAWGGYIRSLFNNDNYEDLEFNNNDSLLIQEYEKELDLMKENFIKKNKAFTRLNDSALKCCKIMDVHESFYDETTIFDTSATIQKNTTFAWNDLEVIKAYMAFKDADSITVDPHKLGYVPYPAGVIAFRNKNVTQFISQKAPYISNNNGEIEKIEIDSINSVGPYIIEGSKPGASAIACWLSEKTIPLTLHSHGKIIKTTLLNAKKFKYYLDKFNSQSENHFVKNRSMISRPFKIMPLYDNIDTNIVCFIIIPLEWNKKTINDNSENDKNTKIIFDRNISLSKINEINQNIYSHFTIINEEGKKQPPHSQKFFLSRTTLSKNEYNYDSISSLLNDKLSISKNEYNKYGLFALRATLMNPWYYDSEKKDNSGRNTNYFLEFIQELYKISVDVINKTKF